LPPVRAVNAPAAASAASEEEEEGWEAMLAVGLVQLPAAAWTAQGEQHS